MEGHNMSKNIFLLAAATGLRFASAKGQLTTEQLFQLPLQSTSGLSLDAVGMQIKRDLNETKEESLIAKASPQTADLELKLDIVMAVIEHKQAENAAKNQKAVNATRRKKLLALQEGKRDEADAKLTPEQIEAELAALDAAV